MRWLLLGLFISVVALLGVAGGVVRHVRRQRRIETGEIPGLEALDFESDKESDSKTSRRDDSGGKS